MKKNSIILLFSGYFINFIFVFRKLLVEIERDKGNKNGEKNEKKRKMQIYFFGIFKKLLPSKFAINYEHFHLTKKSPRFICFLFGFALFFYKHLQIFCSYYSSFYRNQMWPLYCTY